MKAEGWYKDPYGLHEERWFSEGAPTRIVCDGGIESEDPPPDHPYPGELEPVDDRGRPVVHDELDRADDDGPGVRGAWDAFLSSGGD